jgi:hypothetical protein
MPIGSWAVTVHHELPAPCMRFDVALEDGAKILVQRHGRVDEKSSGSIFGALEELISNSRS